MAKEKKKRVKKEKVVAAPKLAAFVDSPVKIWYMYDGKEREATILSSGAILYKNVDYPSPCAAGTAIAKDLGGEPKTNAWVAFKYNKDGERVPLDQIRGSKSPLKKPEPKPKREKKARAKRVRTASKKGEGATAQAGG